MSTDNRLDILKTYKLYVGGAFPRTESGRYFIARDVKGKQIANMCQASKKDVRDAVVAARTAFKGWSARAAFNRSQILYRIAEMLEGRRTQFIEELMLMGSEIADASMEINLSIDRLVYYAGWCDKFQQVFSSVNPVASAHFNFSVPEPMGVVAVIAPEKSGLLGLVSLIAPVIAGGNVCIALGSFAKPLCTITFGEVIHSSDVPAGVVNLITGSSAELSSAFASHMDINAIVASDLDESTVKSLQEQSACNLKRVFIKNDLDWLSNEGHSPYLIMNLQETKTTWHPIENIGGGGAKY
jgi:hypothetical protein